MAVDRSSVDKELEAAKAAGMNITEADPEETAQSKSSVMSSWRKIIAENARLVMIALAIALSVRFFIAEPRYIPSPSMVPTLEVGDRLLVEKISYRMRSPQRGEIIVFEPPPQLQAYGYSSRQAFIKRVIGLPGQRIEVTNGRVIVDGKTLNEPYLLETPEYEMPPVDVPADSLFVMGDNRNDSNDSHIWGTLPQENALGQAIFRFWPLDKIGRIDAYIKRDGHRARRP